MSAVRLVSQPVGWYHIQSRSFPSTVKSLWKYLIDDLTPTPGDPKSRKVDKEDIDISSGKLKVSRKTPIKTMGFLSMLVLSMMSPWLDKGAGRDLRFKQN